MKMFKKTIALLTLVCMMLSINAFAAFSEISTATTVEEVAAGESFTINATFDTLVNAKGMQILFVYDQEAFTVDTADDTEYNWGSKLKPVYWPNYVDDAVKESYKADESLITVWPTFSCSATNQGVMLLATDTDGYVVDAEIDTMINKTFGVVFTAKDDIAPGEYTFTIEAIVSDATVGDIASTKTVTVTVAGDEFVPETKKGAVVEGEDDIVLEKDPATDYDNTYLGTAVFEATLGATDKYSEAGFIWVKDDVETAHKFTVDASVIAGGGTFEYAVAMYAIPANVDIDAIPYYVTAE